MNQKNEKWLRQNFPDLYEQTNTPIYCGDGWFHIIEALSYAISAYIKDNQKTIERSLKWNKEIDGGKVPDWWKSSTPPTKLVVPEVITPVTVSLMKEKFAELRFHYTGGDTMIAGFVRMAEVLSTMTCEECGAPSEVHSIRGWLTTRCQPSCSNPQHESILDDIVYLDQEQKHEQDA